MIFLFLLSISILNPFLYFRSGRSLLQLCISHMPCQGTETIDLQVFIDKFFFSVMLLYPKFTRAVPRVGRMIVLLHFYIRAWRDSFKSRASLNIYSLLSNPYGGNCTQKLSLKRTNAVTEPFRARSKSRENYWCPTSLKRKFQIRVKFSLYKVRISVFKLE